MKLFTAPSSPFARKVRVLLAEKGLVHELAEENVWGPDSRVPAHNPLNKIPTLILDDGTALYDSSVITEYVDSLPGPRFIPGSGLERARIRCLESLADGICDAAVSMVLEGRREAPRQDPNWVARQRSKVDAGLAELSRVLGEGTCLAGPAMTIADIAAGSAVFYLDFRHPGIDWRGQYPNLASWAARLDARPSFSQSRPPAA